jgi:hypothetical protein
MLPAVSRFVDQRLHVAADHLTPIMTIRAMVAGASPSKVNLLVLGAGWTYQFLQPLLEQSKVSYEATTSNGRDGTISFRFDPDSDDPEPFKKLPAADFVLITFPLKGEGLSKKIVSMYEATHPSYEPGRSTKWIQLGSTGVWTQNDWVDANSPIDPANERGAAEEELISLGGCVLNLAGLYGAQRQPANWISRVAKSKNALRDKGALHLIHGIDVSRAIIAVVQSGQQRFCGRRWLIADCVSYDWWQVVWDYTGESGNDGSGEGILSNLMAEDKLKYRTWVIELMEENGVKGLPRPSEVLGRKLDAREFWVAIGSSPARTLRR